MDSFIVFGQYGPPFPDHGHHFYFDYKVQFLYRFNANEVLKEGIIFGGGFYADQKAIYVIDKIRHLIYKISHQGKLLDYYPNAYKASLYLPMGSDVTLYSYGRDKPPGLLDEEYYDFFLYSEQNHKIIEKGVTEVPTYFRSIGLAILTQNSMATEIASAQIPSDDARV